MHRKRSLLGFTLIELLLVLVLLVLTVGIFSRIFLGQAEAHRMHLRTLTGQQSLRCALEIINRDLKGVGYPILPPYFLKEPSRWLPSAYIPRIPRPVVLQGTVSINADPLGGDMISLLLVLSGEGNPTVLSRSVTAGETCLPLALKPSALAALFRPGDVLYLGQPAETAVVEEISGSSVAVDTDPQRPGRQGLKQGYPADTEVGKLSLVSYALFTDENDPGGRYHDLGIPLLKRKINGGGFEPLVEGISALKLEPLPPRWLRLHLAYRFRFSPPEPERTISLETRVIQP